MLPAELLEILVCPECKGDLQYLSRQDALDCVRCSLRYRVEDGVPVMLAAEAERLP